MKKEDSFDFNAGSSDSLTNHKSPMKKMTGSQVDPVDRTVKIEFDEDVVMRKIMNEKKLIDTSRSEWYERKLEYLYQWDNFVEYDKPALMEGHPYFHIPLTHEKMQTWHARMYKTITALDPMFTMTPLNIVSLPEMEATKQILQWYLRDEINYRTGIKPVIDELLWDLGSDGWACIRRKWEILERTMITVVRNGELDQNALREEVMDAQAAIKKYGKPPSMMKEYKEVPKLVKIWSGLTVETIPHECMYFPYYIPTSGDMNYPKILIIETNQTAEDYIRGKEQGYYDAQAVDESLVKGKGYKNSLKRELSYERQRLQGITKQYWKEHDDLVTDIVFYRDDLNNDGIYEEYIFTINTKARKFLRKTFLDRVCSDGKRPVHKFDLMKRPRSSYSRGFPELLYSLNAEVDDFHNIRRISGYIANIPWGVYRAASGFEKEPIEVMPGKFYPVEDTASDIRPMNFPNVTSWAMQEESLAQSYADRLTSMPPYMQGSVSGPIGPLRSNSGLNTLLQEAQAPLDVYLDRFRTSFNGFMQGVLTDLRARLPRIVMLKVLGENGEPLFNENGDMLTQTIDKTRILSGEYKFNLTANDAQYNPEKDKQDSIAVSQMLLTQLGIQTGVVQPFNIYNIYRDNLVKMGKKDFDKYITKPQDMTKPPNLYHEITAIANGMMPIILMNDNHEEKILGLTSFAQSPEWQEGLESGTIPMVAANIMLQAIKAHQKYLQMIQSMPAQPNQSGLEIPVTMGARQAGVGPGQGQELPQNESGGMNGLPAASGGAQSPVPSA